MINTLIWCIIVLAGIAGFAYVAKWIIDSFFPEPAKVIARLLVGVVLLIVLILAAAALFGGGSAANLNIGPSPFRLK